MHMHLGSSSSPCSPVFCLTFILQAPPQAVESAAVHAMQASMAALRGRSNIFKSSGQLRHFDCGSGSSQWQSCGTVACGRSHVAAQFGSSSICTALPHPQNCLQSWHWWRMPRQQSAACWKFCVQGSTSGYTEAFTQLHTRATPSHGQTNWCKRSVKCTIWCNYSGWRCTGEASRR